ncbi:hypothetical protein LCI18_014656 [Fusarium solani-melongenae]|uniref:Uncharacterized protein n=1 Tax=Fusarium solani subsp. cucurbitae TaxID=2747967 RepID=A0ACD3ZRA0_FUSSC|nr:hypothetical protein LCI18_014656 [Fusarium solani-melongenae]
MMAYKYKHQPEMKEHMDLVIYEKNSDIGGTWLENRYLGVACDVPAHIYTFPFEPNSDCTNFYAAGPEIWEYIKRTTDKYQLDERVLFNSKWKVEVNQNGTVIKDEADVLVNGSGILHKWRWPEIKGLDSFKGRRLHSAAWDTSLDWTGKRVAIIGNELTPEGKNFQYTEEQRREFRENPEKLREMRKLIEHHFNQFFYALVVNTQQKAAAKVFQDEMERRLNHDPNLCAKLIPDWKVGCRRLTPGEGYLEALQEPNVTETGIVAGNDSEEEFDILVCATGFDVSFTPFWEVWRDDPEAYFGICAPNMPNYFIFNGPNCPVGHGSLLSVMDWTADYIMRWIKKISTGDIKYFLKRTVSTSGCRSWYKNNKVDGKVTAMYAGTIIHYKEILESFRTEDFTFEYNSRNRFRFMGNGLTVLEEKGEHLGFYVK